MLIPATKLITKSIELYRNNIRHFINYMLILLGATAIGTVLELLIKILESQKDFSQTALITYAFVRLFNGIFGILLFILSIWIMVAFTKAIADKYQNKKSKSIKEEMEDSKIFVFPAIGLSILIGLIIFGGLILLIIPAIIFSVWFYFSFYSLVLDNKKIIESLSTGKELVKGKWFRVFWRLFLITITFYILIFIIAVIFSIPFGYIPGNIVVNASHDILLSAIIFFFSPIYTIAGTILFFDLKNNPQKIETPEPKASTPAEPPVK
jgi:hypothetical protein